MKSTLDKNRFKFAFKYASFHLISTVVVAVLLAIVVFNFWYPAPFDSIVGGLGLYKLVIIIDVICGPLLTFVLFNPKKSAKELLLDMTLVVSIQLSALGYGLYNVYQVKPVAIVFELDSFRIVDNLTVHLKDKDNALPQFQSIPLWGVQFVGVKRASNAHDANKNMNLSLQGIEMGMRVDLWKPYGEIQEDIKSVYQPISKLSKLPNNEKKILKAALERTTTTKENTYFLPLSDTVTGNWIVLLNKEANIIGYANVNGW
ncbi:MAG: fimb protein [Gammaproteobacteria bacterium]|nr:fimb protein [Gammaproteobacteria bacterium]